MIKRVVILEKLGPRPGTERQTAAFLDLFMKSKIPWILDFSGVEALTPEFINGFFGRIAETLGPDTFQKRLSWTQLESNSQRKLHAFLQEQFLEHSNG